MRRWAITFGSSTELLQLPLLVAKFATGTIGTDAFVNVSRLRDSAELIAPLPASILRTVYSTARQLCNGYDMTPIPAVHDRNLTIPVVVRVNSRVAACGTTNSGQRQPVSSCALEIRADVTPVVLSVFPTEGALFLRGCLKAYWHMLTDCSLLHQVLSESTWYSCVSFVTTLQCLPECCQTHRSCWTLWAAD